MRLKHNYRTLVQNKGIVLVACLCTLMGLTGCSYFEKEELPFLNTRVDEGLLVLGSDPSIDDAYKVQKDVEILVKENNIGPSDASSARAENSSTEKARMRQQIDRLNKKLFSTIKFNAKGTVSKTKISVSRLRSLTDNFDADFGKRATDKQRLRLAAYINGAITGKARDQELIADFYLDGISGESYEQLAASWYLLASGKGSTYSKYMLSILYQLGLGLPQDLSESVVWYKRASESKDNAAAKVRIAKRYLHPKSLIRDPKQAFVWMESAALQANIEAQYLLGDMYLQGRGVERSEMEALNWYGKAAEQNSAYAQYSLGVMFYNGQGISQNLLEAKKYLEYAAWQGFSEAQFLLSRMYQQGFGVEKSLPKAYAWIKLIPKDKLYIDNYTDRLDKIVTAMTPTQQIEANKLVNEYKAKVGLG